MIFHITLTLNISKGFSSLPGRDREGYLGQGIPVEGEKMS